MLVSAARALCRAFGPKTTLILTKNFSFLISQSVYPPISLRKFPLNCFRSIISLVDRFTYLPLLHCYWVRISNTQIELRGLTNGNLIGKVSAVESSRLLTAWTTEKAICLLLVNSAGNGLISLNVDK
jgi:hypothetical protein